MPPEGKKIPQHTADFPLGNVNLYYPSKKPFISKSFVSRALDPKGSLLYCYKSHFLYQNPAASEGSCQAAFCAHPRPFGALLLPAAVGNAHALLLTAPPLPHRGHGALMGQRPGPPGWQQTPEPGAQGHPHCFPEGSFAPARLHKPLLPGDVGKGEPFSNAFCPSARANAAVTVVGV